MNFEESIRKQSDQFLTIAIKLSSEAIKERKNFFFSPLSIHVVLSMLTNGASPRAREQLLKFLASDSTAHLTQLFTDVVSGVLADGRPNNGPRLSWANGVWIDESLRLKPSFKQVVDHVYEATSHAVDFKSEAEKVRGEVNSWAEKESSGLIKDLLPMDSIDSSTAIILANALYFKGTWENQFDKAKTQGDLFNLLNNDQKPAHFMTSKDRMYPFDIYDDFKVLGLPFLQGGDAGRHFTMYIFLPHNRNDLSKMLHKLSTESDFLERYIPITNNTVFEVQIPRFKISYGFEGTKILGALGLTEIFSPGGLTEMVDSSYGDGFYVDGFYHKAYIAVNEEGVEAAAATACVIVQCMKIYKTENIFIANHPFFFLIREDKSGVVLFIGHVLDIPFNGEG